MTYFRRLFIAVTGGILMIGSANADQVILDDLIVDGSACVGFDCVNGESFGFDTIRVKENNLRIHFQDTSTSASFPTNDWRLVANDTSNGGANKFSIEDVDGGRTPFTTEAGAPSHSLYIDDGGRLGFGTNVPVTDLHVKSGNTPTLRLEQDGSSGFSAQTWDLAGNEANLFLRDASNGSTLPFRLFPGAPSNALTIEASGDIGMGTTSPDQSLDIENAGPVGIDMNNSSITEVWRIRAGGAGNLVIADASVSGTDEVVISPTGDVTILGGLITGTVGSCESGTPCDAVFQPDKFEVPSIEEHADYMWNNSYLKAVGPTKAGEPFNVTRKTTGILHELEIAHIYIEQLHKEIKQIREEKAAIVTNLEERLLKLESQ